MIMEYCEGGQLDTWIACRRGKVDESVMENLFQFSLSNVKGMEYLASKEVLHNRLAARNILLSSCCQANVAGFDSQTKEGDDEAEKNTRIPAKWAAPEVLMKKKPSTEKSDVWSYGVVLWEILSMDEVPYPGIHSTDIGSRLKEGYRTEKKITRVCRGRIMKDCWQYKPNKRPTFHNIRATLTQQLSPCPASYFGSSQLTG